MIDVSETKRGRWQISCPYFLILCMLGNCVFSSLYA
jgi:hypothetical protein